MQSWLAAPVWWGLHCWSCIPWPTVANAHRLMLTCTYYGAQPMSFEHCMQGCMWSFSDIWCLSPVRIVLALLVKVTSVSIKLNRLVEQATIAPLSSTAKSLTANLFCTQAYFLISMYSTIKTFSLTILCVMLGSGDGWHQNRGSALGVCHSRLSRHGWRCLWADLKIYVALSGCLIKTNLVTLATLRRLGIMQLAIRHEWVWRQSCTPCQCLESACIAM